MGQEGEGDGAQEGPLASPGGMRGVKVYKNETRESREVERERPQKPTAPLEEKERHLVLSPIPPSTRPVQLFAGGGVGKALGNWPPREGETAEGEGGTGVQVMSKDTASKEVEWHDWKLGNHVGKVRVLFMC